MSLRYKLSLARSLSLSTAFTSLLENQNLHLQALVAKVAAMPESTSNESARCTSLSAS